MTVLSDILVVTAAGMFVLGYLIINQVILRVMLLVGTLLYIWYYFVVAQSPLWPAIWASAATGLANLVGLLQLLFRRSRLAIPAQFKDLYDQFTLLNPGDFRKLMSAAQRHKRPAGHTLTRSSERVQTLFYVIDGTVTIKKYGNDFVMHGNSFVGEVAFLTGEPASATTVLTSDSDVLEWDVQETKRRVRRDPRLGLALDAMISLDLARKVALSGKPDGEHTTGSPDYATETAL